MIPQTYNDEFELWDVSYFVLHIKYYIKYIIKRHKMLATIPPFYIYINRTNIRLVFKIKDGYKLELKTPETMKSFGITTKLKEK